jgi:hypothetical protein
MVGSGTPVRSPAWSEARYFSVSRATLQRIGRVYRDSTLFAFEKRRAPTAQPSFPPSADAHHRTIYIEHRK